MMQLNKQQQKAYNAKKQNMIVSASAGTGKTTLISQRLAHLIVDENISIDDVLVMSFTEFAASELKEKLANALKERIQTNQDKEDYILNQIALIPSSLVCTMHSFCLDVIKNYSYALTIDPLLVGNVATDSQIANFEQMAMDRTLADVSKYNDLINVLCSRVEDISNLTKSIKIISNQLENQANKEEYFNRIINIYENLAVGKLVEPLASTYQQLVNNKVEEALSLLAEIKNYFSLAKKGNEEFLGIYEDITNGLKCYRIEQSSKNLELFNVALPTRYKEKEEDETITNSWNKASKNYKATIKELVEISQQRNNVQAYGKATTNYIKQLIELTRNYLNNYQQIKQEYHYIDYGDMEDFAFEILKNNEDVADELRNRFKEIIIDEYQDTNEKQEAVIQLICRDNNVFRVGDVKQSIYGFRGSKPDIMKAFTAKASENELTNLIQNFRCDQSIINFTNEMFAQLMNLIDPDSFLRQDKIEAGSTKQAENNNIVKFYRLSVDDKDKANIKNRKMCSFITNQIIDLHDNKHVDYNKITILTRKNKTKYLLKDYLASKNIPCFCSYDGGFYNDEAVNSCISLLSLIVDRQDTMSLIDVLAGPIFHYSYDEISLYHLDKDKLSLYDYLRSINHDVSVFVEHLADVYRKKGIIDVVNEIYSYNSFYYSRTSTNQRSNLDELYQIIISLSAKDASLINLLNYFKIERSENDKKDAMYISKRDDVVSIMTIHQSKGLENDNVIIAEFASKAAQPNALIIDDDLGFCFDFVELPKRIKIANLYRSLILFNKEYKELKEENRLLYVATTRAKKRLILVSFDEDLENKEFNYHNVLAAKDYSDRFLLAANKKPYLKKLFEVENVDVDDCDVNIDYPHKEYQIVKYEGETNKADKIAPSKTHVREIHNLNFDYHGDVRGTNMHKAIELSGLTYDENMIAGIDLENDDLAKIKAFYDNELTKSLVNYQHYHELPYLDQGVNGIIDLLVISKETIYIIDFKSDVNVNKEILKERYIDQLQAYKDVISKAYPKYDVKTLIYSFDLNEYVEV